MKRLIFIIGIVLLAFSMGCKKNDDRAPVEIALQNEPPLGFNLLDVPDDASDVDLTPTLNWESAKNPKGGNIIYDLYLGTDVNPTTLFESGIAGTSFEITERLHLITDYYWKILAKDVDGKTSQSAVHKFSTRNFNIPEGPVLDVLDLLEREAPAITVFDEKIWVIGGHPGGFGVEAKNDVWYSTNGSDWTEATESADFSPRSGHIVLAHDGKMWLIGGWDSEPKNDVWNSTDGIHWSQVNTAAPFSARLVDSAVVFDDKLWVIGGWDDDGYQYDVWHTTNGIDWTDATPDAPFYQGNNYTSVVFKSKIWMIGGADNGGAKNETWSSDDGINWTKANDNNSFFEKRGLTTAVFDDRLWIIGGYDGDYKNGVWYSNDGTDWKEAISSTAFSERGYHVSIVFDHKLWVFGGWDGELKSDIWAIY